MNVHRFAHKALSRSLLAIASCALLSAFAQQPNPFPSQVSHPFGYPHNEHPTRLEQTLMKERNTLRQQELVDDTNRLFDLARQLREEVGKSTKDQLSLTVVKKAAEIEKLAKSVKNKMRDGP